jgi:hypothetical protein
VQEIENLFQDGLVLPVDTGGEVGPAAEQKISLMESSYHLGPSIGPRNTPDCALLLWHAPLLQKG